MRDLTILLDCDGVLADFAGAVLRVARDLGGPALAVGDLAEYDIFSHAELQPYEERALREMSKPGFCASIEAYPDAAAGVEALRALGTVYCLTAPLGSRHWLGERAEWLREHFGFGPEHVIFAHAKHLVRGDVFVDDRPANVAGWWHSHRTPGGQPLAVLWDRSYNRNARETHGNGWWWECWRCCAWPELVGRVEEYR